MVSPGSGRISSGSGVATSPAASPGSSASAASADASASAEASGVDVSADEVSGEVVSWEEASEVGSSLPEESSPSQFYPISERSKKLASIIFNRGIFIGCFPAPGQ